MNDTLYKPEDVDAESRPIFEQLRAEFGATYQIWRRVEDFGRLVTAAVLDPSTENAAKISIRRGTRTRALLSSSEIKKIRKHLMSGAKEDLVLKGSPSRITRPSTARAKTARR
jgi:hypothetical protein